MGRAEVAHERFELRPRERGFVVDGGHDAGERARPAARRAGVDGRVDAGEVEQPQLQGPLDGPLERPAGEHAGDVDERPGDGGDGDPVAPRDVRRAEGARAMHDDAGTPRPPSVRRDRHVDRRRAACAQLPERGRADMAQDGAVAGSEERRDPASLARQPRVTDREDPAVQAMQPARPHADVDRAQPQPRVAQLVEAHDPVLRRGEPGDPRVRVDPVANVLHVNT